MHAGHAKEESVGAPDSCAKCGTILRSDARFCAHCGAPARAAAVTQPGRVMHDHPFPAPDGFKPCKRACDLFYHWQHGSDRPILGAETVVIQLFNAGYGLRNITLLMEGRTSGGEVVLKECEIAALDAGAIAAVEIPSYDLPGQVDTLDVSLQSAEFASRAPMR